MHPNELPMSLQGPLDTLMRIVEEKIREAIKPYMSNQFNNVFKRRTILLNKVLEILEPYNIEIVKFYPKWHNDKLVNLDITYQFKPLNLNMDFKENTEE